MAELSRRGFFSRILGRSEETGSAGIVDDYRRLVSARSADLPWGIPESELPAPAESLRGEILKTLEQPLRPGEKERLRTAYVSLPWFRSEQEVALLRRAKRAVDDLDSSEEGRAAIMDANQIRGSVMGEVNRVAAEFDEAYRRHQLAVRPATADDAGALAEIEQAARKAVYRRHVSEESLAALSPPADEPADALTVVLLREGRRLTGYVRFRSSETEPAADVLALAVHPTDWRKGYGRMLCAHALEALAAKGAREARIWVFEHAWSARVFLEKAGFQPTGAERPDRSFASELHEIEYHRALA